jgi:hypothetical protein
LAAAPALFSAAMGDDPAHMMTAVNKTLKIVLVNIVTLLG